MFAVETKSDSCFFFETKAFTDLLYKLYTFKSFLPTSYFIPFSPVRFGEICSNISGKKSGGRHLAFVFRLYQKCIQTSSAKNKLISICSSTTNKIPTASYSISHNNLAKSNVKFYILICFL